jgi:NADH-quinone oxidoreductase subunit J
LIPQALFFYFAGMTILSAIVAIAAPNLVFSALSLLVTFIHIAGLYILLHAEFVAAVQIIVYAGAILVLYLFVLMLFNPKSESVGHGVPFYLHQQFPVAIFLGLVLFGLMTLAVFRTEILGQKNVMPTAVTTVARGVRQSLGNTQAIGNALYTDFIFPFEIASLILLVGLIGAILLAGRHLERKKQ